MASVLTTWYLEIIFSRTPAYRHHGRTHMLCPQLYVLLSHQWVIQSSSKYSLSDRKCQQQSTHMPVAFLHIASQKSQSWWLPWDSFVKLLLNTLCSSLPVNLCCSSPPPLNSLALCAWTWIVSNQGQEKRGAVLWHQAAGSTLASSMRNPVFQPLARWALLCVLTKTKQNQTHRNQPLHLLLFMVITSFENRWYLMCSLAEDWTGFLFSLTPFVFF